MITYPIEVTQQMKCYYESLSEKDRRRYAAIEAIKLGYGGINYICQLFDCNYRTVQLGMQELQSQAALKQQRIRKSGAGRKSSLATLDGLEEAFLRVIEEKTAGSPMDEAMKWTHLTRQQIAEALALQGFPVSVTVVAQLLEKDGFRKRKALKSVATGQSENRNEQFENISRLKQEYTQAANPVISMDTKKKELIGNLYREGKVFAQAAQQVYDHDFPSLAEGIAIPHGLYDVEKNLGYIHIGTSKETSEFACDSIRKWWEEYGKLLYPLATSILLICDGGGSNRARTYLFKEALQKLANEIGIEIRIAHYPPYTSKYNPIEHRLFPHITRVCQGVILRSVESAAELMSKATTKKGLKVFTAIIEKTYEVGKKVAQDFKENMKIVFDDFLPLWNYRAIPEQAQL